MLSQDPAIASQTRDEELGGAAVGQAVEAIPGRASTGTRTTRALVLIRRPARALLRMLRRAQGTRRATAGDVQDRLQLHFKAMIAFVAAVSLLWMLNFLLVVQPAAEEERLNQGDGLCKYSNDQLRQSALMLFVYYALFGVLRLLLFVPRIMIWVAKIHEGQRGPCAMYTMHMALHGPLYVFAIGSILFWAQILQSRGCEKWAPLFYRIVKLNAVYSCAASVICLAFAFWHTHVLKAAVRRQEEEERRAPLGTIDKIPTCPYDPAKFGDDGDKLHPCECPICLAEWEPQDIIKVTPCGHAFHKECLGKWLRSDRTCAMCRRDLTQDGLQVSMATASTDSRLSASLSFEDIMPSMSMSEEQVAAEPTGALHLLPADPLAAAALQADPQTEAVVEITAAAGDA